MKRRLKKMVVAILLAILVSTFSVITFAFADSDCPHTDLFVWDVQDDNQCACMRIDDERHSFTTVYTSRELLCYDCGETLDSISYNLTITGEEEHCWDYVSALEYECYLCGATIKLEPICEHEDNIFMAEDGYLYCSKCDAFGLGMYHDSVCTHEHCTIYYPDTPYDEYYQWDADTHLKHTQFYVYSEEDDLPGFYDGNCEDCGAWILYDYESGAYSYGVTIFATYDWKFESGFEAHNFVDGVCEQCGQTENAAQ